MNRSSSAISRPPAEIVVRYDLRERDQWMLWRYEERNGKATTKVPYQLQCLRADRVDRFFP